MRDFLCWLWEDATELSRGYLAELRVIGEQGYRTQRFYELPQGLDRLMADARNDDDAGLEVYVGVLPRIRHRGTAADTSFYTRLLWADVDAKHHGDSKSRALAAIIDFPVPPSVIVDSGNGYHCYWELDRVHDFDTVQPVMKGIAQRIGGDHVYDRARILRIPGLSNHKHGGNAPVRLIRFDTTLSYRLSDLTEYTYREPVALPPPFVCMTADEAAFLDERIERELVIDPGKGARSGHDFYVACLMVEAGYSDEHIATRFSLHPQGVGAKYAEAGGRYLERTIRKARQAVGR